MVKLLKNEWKRYGTVMIALAIGTAAAAVLDAVCIMLYGTSEFMDVMSAMTVAMLTVLIVIVPIAAFIFPVISYAVDISRRGLLFLTPVPVWLAVLTKVLFGAAAGLALSIESQGLVALLSAMINIAGGDSDMSEIVEFMSVNDIAQGGAFVSFLTSIMTTVTTVIHGSLSIMAAISLARFAVSNTGGCVVLSIVFSYLINIIETMIMILIAYISEDAGIILDFYTGFFGAGDLVSFVVPVCSNIIYSGIFYAICTGLTSRKINLA